MKAKVRARDRKAAPGGRGNRKARAGRIRWMRRNLSAIVARESRSNG
jgi:hypothetical protein